MLEIEKRNKVDTLEISTVNKIFIQFFLDRFNNSITIAASTKSIITNNQSSPTFHPSDKRISTASKIILTISQNTQLFNQDLILSMIFSLINKKLPIFLIAIISQLSTQILIHKIYDFIPFYLHFVLKFLQ